MKAAIHERYGSEHVEVREVERPEPTEDGVLVRVRAASINRADWYGVAGKPLVARPMMGGVRKPKDPSLGGDFAGVVEAVGAAVTDFRPGDEVFGARHGSLAEYVCVPHDAGIGKKPANLTFEQAAAVPLAALTALQGLRDHGALEQGQNVLVNGASGGVGTFAVQIARALGGKVTAVCNARHVEVVRSLGAERVVDYTREDFTRSDDRYDLMLDVAGSRSLHACKRVLKPEATVVLVGGPMTPIVGPLAHIGAMKLGSLGGSRKVAFFVAKPNRADMEALRELLEAGKIEPVVERRFELHEIGDALNSMGEGHAQGKLVVAV
jgi:NADPH:quinone reductase-like Zn-dependent oxidoreductase